MLAKLLGRRSFLRMLTAGAGVAAADVGGQAIATTIAPARPILSPDEMSAISEAFRKMGIYAWEALISSRDKRSTWLTVYLWGEFIGDSLMFQNASVKAAVIRLLGPVYGVTDRDIRLSDRDGGFGGESKWTFHFELVDGYPKK